jgi:ribosome maturation factor RimP
MEKEKGLIERLMAILEPLVEHAGKELVDMEYLRSVQGVTLRLTIDKPGGITLDDCEEVSRLASDALDARDFMPGHYNLEVSSPGINRILKRKKDFERFKGEKVYIELKEPMGGKRRYKGLLEDVNEERIYINFGGTAFEIPLDKISKARLDMI